MALIPQPFRTYKLGPPRSDARQRVLAQWRGIDLTATEKARAARSRSAGDILPQVLKDLRIDRRRSEAEVLRVWNHLIDPTIVAHAQPTGLLKGTLFVTVDSSAWLSEIVRYRRKEILNRLQHSFGSDLITRISFRLG
jgi:predicted nucleic acid-binding Zn ribbon protein